MMEIRHTQTADLPVLLGIFAHARRFMAETAIPTSGPTVSHRAKCWKRILRRGKVMCAWTAVGLRQRFAFRLRVSRLIV